MPKRKITGNEKKIKKVGGKPIKNSNGGLKHCLRCNKQFMSTDVRCNRICVPCGRLNNKERFPGTYKSGISFDGDDL